MVTVFVLRLHLRHALLHTAAGWELLDGRERGRAGALRQEDERQRFVLAHIATRVLLSRVTGYPAAALPIERRCGACGSADHGRPFLAQQAAPSFSVSRSRDLAGIAISFDAEVGLDIEAIHADIADDDGLAQQVLTSHELADWNSHPRGFRAELLTRLWTIKEAELKRRGVGLTVSPTSIDADVLLANRSTAHLAMPLGYAGAVAAEPPGAEVRVCSLTIDELLLPAM